MFVKLTPTAAGNPEKACEELRSDFAALIPLRQYRANLENTYGIMFTYINIVNVIALVIAFLFIMITLYMMVIQRTRDIAILKSCGASNTFIWNQLLAESLLLTAVGPPFGILLKLPRLVADHRVQAALHRADQPAMGRHRGGRCPGGLAAERFVPCLARTRVDMVEALAFE